MAAINQPNTKNPVLVSPVENVPVAIPSPVTQIREIPLTVVLTKYTWLDSTGEILPGHPGSVVAGSLASVFGSSNQTSILDCIANLQGAVLSFANLQGAKLIAANLQGAKLIAVNLQGANLTKTNLQEANQFAPIH